MQDWFKKATNMAYAQNNEESPLVEALQKLGLYAGRNDGSGLDNRVLGDVYFGFPTTEHSDGVTGAAELQIAKSQKSNNLSWELSKVLLLREQPLGTYAVLGSFSAGDVRFVVLETSLLNKLLREGKIARLLDADKNFETVRPDVRAALLQMNDVTNTAKQIFELCDGKFFVIPPVQLVGAGGVPLPDIDAVARYLAEQASKKK